MKTNVNLSDTKQKLNEEIERIQSKNDELSLEIRNIKSEVGDKNDAIKLMQESIMKHGENEGHLANRLMELKEELFEAKSYY
jgi:uncharacterized coiled-coil DUF342 family protein